MKSKLSEKLGCFSMYLLIAAIAALILGGFAMFFAFLFESGSEMYLVTSTFGSVGLDMAILAAIAAVVCFILSLVFTIVEAFVDKE